MYWLFIWKWYSRSRFVVYIWTFLSSNLGHLVDFQTVMVINYRVIMNINCLKHLMLCKPQSLQMYFLIWCYHYVYLMQLLIKKCTSCNSNFKRFSSILFEFSFLFFLIRKLIKEKEILSKNIHVKFMDPNKEHFPHRIIVKIQLKLSYIF